MISTIFNLLATATAFAVFMPLLLLARYLLVICAEGLARPMLSAVGVLWLVVGLWLVL